MTATDVDALELELRRLPEVVAVSIRPAPGQVGIHLLAVVGDAADLRKAALHIAEGHTEGGVIIDVSAVGAGEAAGERTHRQRVQLLTVRQPPRGEEIEVHLAFGGSRTVGRGAPGSLAGTVNATVDALLGLGARVPFGLKAATRVGIGDDLAVLVVFSDRASADRMGIALAPTVEESACRATLHALNRFLDQADVFRRPDGTVLAG